jgi:hypothetical protein
MLRRVRALYAVQSGEAPLDRDKDLRSVAIPMQSDMLDVLGGGHGSISSKAAKVVEISVRL